MSTVFSKLGDLVKISKGRKVNNIFREPKPEFHRFIQIDDLRNDNNLKYTDDYGLFVDSNDIIIAWDGANAGTIGYGLSGIIGSTLAALTLKTDQIDSEYLGRFLQTKSEYLRRKCTGATIPHISKDILLNLSVPIVPIEEQHRIIKILDLAQSLIEKRKQAIALLDDYIKAVFLDMFGDPVSNPKGWEIRKLGDLTILITDGKHGDCENSENSGYYFISAKDIHNGIIDYSKARQIKKEDFEEVHKRTNLKPGDLVMVNTGATIGKMAISTDDLRTQNTTFQKSVAVIKLNEILLNNNYLKFLLAFKLIHVVKALSGSAQQNLLLSQIRKIQIITPPLELQNNFDKIVRESEIMNQKMQSQLNELEDNFQAELQRAFRGE